MTAMPPGEGLLRPPVVAGRFYRRNAADLRNEIAEAFCSPLGPGAVPQVEAGPRQLLGVIVPHAGYMFSGPGAAWSFAAMAQDGRPSAVVLLGVNHTGMGAPLAMSPAAGWETPLGVLPVDQALGERLQALDPEVTWDARSHHQEHSLEVELPFLQYLFAEIPILPITVSGVILPGLERLGQALAVLARERDLVIIASTDFSHYVSQAEAERLDRMALACIAAVDPAGLYTTVRARRITMCGVLPVTVLLATAQALGIRTAQVLHYHTSGDVIGDRREVVGYGAAAVYR